MDQDALRSMLSAYLAAWRRGDAATCIGFYADDARMEDPALPVPLRGREGVEAYFRRSFAERPPDTRRELINVALGESRIFFEWTIDSGRGASRGVSVWDVEGGKVKRDRSYWHEEQGREGGEAPGCG